VKEVKEGQKAFHEDVSNAKTTSKFPGLFKILEHGRECFQPVLLQMKLESSGGWVSLT